MKDKINTRKQSIYCQDWMNKDHEIFVSQKGVNYLDIKVDDVIKELEKYRGKSIVEIDVHDINIGFELKGITKIEVYNAWCIDENEECKEVALYLTACR